MANQQEYDLLLVIDSTASMGSYLQALNQSIPQILSISILTDAFKRIGILAYRDYDHHPVNIIQWSGWVSPADANTDSKQPDLMNFAKRLLPSGGGDPAEATKTALAKAYLEMRDDATTIVLLFTDAPPHTAANSNPRDPGDLTRPEISALAEDKVYGEIGASFVDWVNACKLLTDVDGGKKTQVFTIHAQTARQVDYCYYTYLSTVTGGSMIQLSSVKVQDIASVTIAVLLTWMGAEKKGANQTDLANVDLVSYPAKFISYAKVKGIKDIAKETDEHAITFFAPTRVLSRKFKPELTEAAMTSKSLLETLPCRTLPIRDFAQRYAAEDRLYRRVVIEQLQQIISEYPMAITTNPVFGSLWRMVCKDRGNEQRQGLIAAFSLAVDRISDEADKKIMQAWIEESYDFSSEVLSMINSVPEDERFPCVFMDPTVSFTADAREGADESEENNSAMDLRELKRDDLLEIGRSCDPRILRRLGHCLTRLTYVAYAEDMPDHIRVTKLETLQKIPLALASRKYHRQFWKILLHLIVPGTLLSARPAALLAALAYRMRIAPLLEIAEEEMLNWRENWNDLEVPETFNLPCLSLLLDVDLLYCEENDIAEKTPLSYTDKALFEKLVTHKLLEMNLDTTLKAKTSWTPDKSPAPLGPVTVCNKCGISRSVTVMGPDHICGLCLDQGYVTPKEHQQRLISRATETEGIWVECSERTCRGQYVVYNPRALNVRAKCFYCRQEGLPIESRLNRERKVKSAPLVECITCHNRIIYPDVYRPARLSIDSFKCYACQTDQKSIVEIEITARYLNNENTTDWLVQNGSKIRLFDGRSIFNMASTIGQTKLTHLEFFPPSKNPLTIRSKVIHNDADVTAQLRSWVSLRKKQEVTCDLCFTTRPRHRLLRACGRRGCTQRLDAECLRAWYGTNAAGKVINVTALMCPFCRRAPAAAVLARYGLGVHAVGDLKKAVDEVGRWIYAWCRTCNHAKEYVERVCAVGQIQELSDWECNECMQEEYAADEIANLLALSEAEEAANHRDQELAGEQDLMSRHWATKDRRLQDRLTRAWMRSLPKCPGCGMATEKVGGCDHILCPHCETDWCYYCGKAQGPNSSIYRHIMGVHGGLFPPEYVDAEEEDEDE